MDLELGNVVADRYRLERFLGEGGMGAVWAARHVVTGKTVALKVLKGGSEEHRRRFVQEARVAAAIRHPNVVDVHDVLALPDGRPVLVMDLLEGEPLSEAIERRGRYSLEELGPIMLQVLAGIGAAHAAGVVHRDLKPENVFLCGDTVKVLDFGIAKLTALTSAIQHTAALTQTGSVLGTPMYMAPEQVFGESRSTTAPTSGRSAS
jgi:serine/threonine-protein kinase